MKETNIEWYLIDNENDYELAMNRFQELRDAETGTRAHKEKMLLVHLIEAYEDKSNDLPDVDPIELIKIRMEDFGYKSKDLAEAYGDKGTVSKVLSYKQALSISMIRKFSQLLHIPADRLVTEYPLKAR